MTILAAGAKPADALKAFQTILTEMEKVRPLNYRNRLFTNWKTIVQTALTRFLGPDHPSTTAFSALVFHGPMPKSPMDPIVSQKDIDAYEASMAATGSLLANLVAALAGEMAPAAPAAAAAAPQPAAAAHAIIPPPPPGIGTASPGPLSFPPPPPAAPAADSGFRVTRGTSDMVAQFAQSEASAPALSAAASATSASSAHDLPRHTGGIPQGGLKIVSRSGVSAATTIDQYLEGITDAMEREIVGNLRDAMNDPNCRWDVMKDLLAELWWQKKESFQKILPIILRR